MWVAPSPLGPWTDTEVDINPPAGAGDILGLGDREVRAQCNGVVTITGEEAGTRHLYTGDLWSSAPDSLKSHDIQYWSPPLEFDDTQEPPSIRPMRFVHNFTISL